MARPSTGNVVLWPGGRFQASVSVERCSTRRHYEMFDTKAQEDAWCTLAVANLAAGLPLPSRDAVLGEGVLSRRARTPVMGSVARAVRTPSGADGFLAKSKRMSTSVPVARVARILSVALGFLATRSRTPYFLSVARTVRMSAGLTGFSATLWRT
jgi:hypothetical protein